MNKERTFLITGLFTLALIIMVVETGMIHFRSKPLVAQYKVDGVQLIHDQYKTEVIPFGALVTLRTFDEKFFFGRLNDLENGLITLEFESKGVVKVGIDQIKNIYIGEYLRARDYFYKGIFRGATASAGLACLSIVMGLTSNGEDAGNVIGCGLMFGAFTMIGTVPAGLIVTYIESQIKKGNIREYQIGPNQWTVTIN